MKALFLEDVEKLVLGEVAEPVPAGHEVLIQVEAVGVCGTDLHIYRGHANYNLDRLGQPIPLSQHPQILGHEFCGTVLETGREVQGLKSGDRVAVDQGLNCFSQLIRPACEYCRSGHSHQCQYFKELGITGIPGGLQERVVVPAINLVRLPNSVSFQEAALTEPLGCIIHALDQARNLPARYGLEGNDGERPVSNLLIFGAGPAGLLFLQYLRKVLQFHESILVADFIKSKLDRVEQFGGTPIDLKNDDLVEATQELTQGAKVDFVIEAAGHASALAAIPSVARKQATVVLYGHGHKGRDLSILSRLFYLEPTLVVPVGASGPLDPETHQPLTHRKAVEHIANGLINVETLLTHRYARFEDVEKAFREDFQKPEYIKGVLVAGV